jgi:hypothetical protein
MTACIEKPAGASSIDEDTLATGDRTLSTPFALIYSLAGDRRKDPSSLMFGESSRHVPWCNARNLVSLKADPEIFRG